jgi:hypothetical protein
VAAAILQRIRNVSASSADPDGSPGPAMHETGLLKAGVTMLLQGHPAGAPVFTQASSIRTNPWQAVEEIRQGLGPATKGGVIVFCSSHYDLEVLGPALKEGLGPHVLGCTTAGQLSDRGFQKSGICALAWAGDSVRVRHHVLDKLQGDCEGAAVRLGEQVRQDIRHAPAEMPAFALLLVDGLSMVEERLTRALYQALPHIPLVGGSAGDDLCFKNTHVYVDGTFRRDVASLAVFQTAIPFHAFKFQHYVPTRQRLVITRATPATRTVHEINGLPAAEGFASELGVAPEQLTPDQFSRSPVMMRVGDDWYVRAVQRAEADGSLVFYCAIDAGLVLSLGVGVDPVTAAQAAFESVRAKVGPPQLVIGFDCILRRLELEQSGWADRVGQCLAANKVVGFSTYGEQFNSLHINQTFTGVALGGG